MRVTDLIKALNDVLNRHGDIPVGYLRPDKLHIPLYCAFVYTYMRKPVLGVASEETARIITSSLNYLRPVPSGENIIDFSKYRKKPKK